MLLGNRVMGECCCVFNVLDIKSLQTTIARIAEGKVSEFICIEDDFRKVFDD